MSCRTALFFLLLFGLSVSPLEAGRLRPFVSDGCSHFPNGTLFDRSRWLPCCVAHDRAYWQGGTYEEKLAADEALRACVAATGEEIIGEIMLQGVHAGGSAYLPTEFRWGYGWPYPRGYTPLTNEERKEVERMQSTLPQQ